MVRDAEANAEADKKFAELANSRNEADGRIAAVQKALKENADKATDEEKQAVENAIKELELATKEDDVEAIKTKLEALDNAFLPIASKIYSQEGANPADFAGQAGAQANTQKADDGVVDAEFTEVKDDKNNHQ